MIQTHLSVGCPGYSLTTADYTQSGDTLRKRGNITLQPLRMFQFILGESKFTFALTDFFTCFQTIALLHL